LRCLPKAAGSRATRDDATRFFSLSEHFSEKALRLQIASTKIPTASDCPHDFADQRNAYVNANNFRITKRELSKNDTANQQNDREEVVEVGEGPSRLPAPTEQTSPVRSEVPQRILDPILNEAAALANVAPEQLVIVRAESVVWNDGSLGCPEPGMMYTQALVNGYWVVINAADRIRITTFASIAEVTSDCARPVKAIHRHRPPRSSPTTHF
jgi:hypothetical protein